MPQTEAPAPPSGTEPPSDEPPLRRASQPERFLVSDLLAMLESYLEPEEIKQIYSAYLFGAEAHDGQVRMSGEAYIFHPLAVARILAEMHMDSASITAALLHDVVEDTDITLQDIEDRFGKEVALLVDGVSKLTHLKFESRAEAQAANFRKMMLAMARDLRVILVKLADRLHNMRTLGVMPPEKRRRIARETLEIYAPIAQRLGMNAFRRELEQLGFQALYPARYRVLKESVERAKGKRKELMQQVETAIVHRLEERGIEGRVHGREKNLWSIYRKMRDKKLSFSEILDVFAIRIVVQDIDTCYRTLGALHTLYKPLPGRFKDYIAIPKVNGYQSLHTVLFGPHGIAIEVQIRTEAMDYVAESGIAAHWHYKSGDEHTSAAQRRAHEWLKSMMDMQQNTGNALEFLESVKVDLFPDEVYVFTPQGEIKALPRGATGVDFAYAVHTDIGNHCVAVKVDKHLTPLSTPLQNGQTVEVITAPNARPQSAWLHYAVTAKARNAIRHRLKSLQHSEAVAQGRRLLDKALQEEGTSLAELPQERLDALLERLGYEALDDLLRDIGLGKRLANLVARRLLDRAEGEGGEGRAAPLVVQGTEGMVLNFAKCCTPIPGDPIVGLLTAGRGIVVHRSECKNVAKSAGAEEDRVIAVEWAQRPEGEFPANIRVLTVNQRGALASIATVISSLQGDIANVSLSEQDAMSTYINLTVNVRDRKHLADIIRRLRHIREVIRISRTMN